MNAHSPLHGTVTVTLPAELGEQLRAAVENGEHGSTGEIVREAVQDWLDAQEHRRRALEKLRGLIQEGIDSGPGIPAEEVFAELRARYAGED